MTIRIAITKRRAAVTTNVTMTARIVTEMIAETVNAMRITNQASLWPELMDLLVLTLRLLQATTQHRHSMQAQLLWLAVLGILVQDIKTVLSTDQFQEFQQI